MSEIRRYRHRYNFKEVELYLAQEKELSPALRSMIGILILIVKLLTNRIGLNNNNSSKLSSSVLNRKKKTRKTSNKKASGQKKHPGTTLKRIDDPDENETFKINQRSLPKDVLVQEICICRTKQAMA